MKLSKDKIIEAAKAFNQAKNFDEFKIMLDLCNVTLEDFERDYYEVASIHPVFKDIISCGGKLSGFNSKLFMALDPKKILNSFMESSQLLKSSQLLSRFKLPLWFEKDEFDTVGVMTADGKFVMASFSSFSQELVDDMLSLHNIDINKEMSQTLMYELARA